MNQHQWRRFPLAVAKILHPHEGTTISCDIFFYVKCCKKISLQIFFFTHLHDMGSRINVALVKKGWYITGFMKQNNSEVFPSTKKKNEWSLSWKCPIAAQKIVFWGAQEIGEENEVTKVNQSKMKQSSDWRIAERFGPSDSFLGVSLSFFIFFWLPFCCSFPFTISCGHKFGR